VKVDLTVAAIPAFFGAMIAEYVWQRRHPVPAGTRAGDYQLADTLASLSMGVGSLAAPYVAKRVLDPVTPGVGRFAKVLVGVGAAAGLATTIGDVLLRSRREGGLPEAGTVPEDVRVVQDELAELRLAPAAPLDQRPPRPRLDVRRLRRAHAALAVSAVTSTALTVATTWAAQTSGKRMFARGGRDLGTGKGALALAILGWDFLYYWNHRFSHESRWMWAVHVAHHSSEHYNLSTALRQSVTDPFLFLVPYSTLSLVGVRPEIVATSRSLNLIYQYWVHTDAIERIGPAEAVMNTPSHHRVHHGVNPRYIDRNHGGILILWDRLFGTFEPEDETVVYGLTKNIHTFNPLRVATHEYVDRFRAVARSRTWRDRLSFVFRGPGWAYERHRQDAAAAA
jgi:sterol desaturase/sphingolipid hydroxylase (fatty acid hydroxylase superfamily)